jgi:hypothetical protein
MSFAQNVEKGVDIIRDVIYNRDSLSRITARLLKSMYDLKKATCKGGFL